MAIPRPEDIPHRVELLRGLAERARKPPLELYTLVRRDARHDESPRIDVCAAANVGHIVDQTTVVTLVLQVPAAMRKE